MPACMHPYWRHCRRKQHEDDPDGEAAKMTPTLSIVRSGAAEDVARESEQPRNAAAEAPEKAWDAQQFAQEQIRGLVRRVFLQGWPRPARQVVFSSAGSQVEVASVCRKAGEVLAAERAGRVALVEANVRTKALELSFGRTSNDGEDSTETAGALRKSSRQVGRNLWLVSAAAFLGCGENGNNSAWLLSRRRIKAGIRLCVNPCFPSWGSGWKRGFSWPSRRRTGTRSRCTSDAAAERNENPRAAFGCACEIAGNGFARPSVSDSGEVVPKTVGRGQYGAVRHAGNCVAR